MEKQVENVTHASKSSGESHEHTYMANFTQGPIKYRRTDKTICNINISNS